MQGPILPLFIAFVRILSQVPFTVNVQVTYVLEIKMTSFNRLLLMRHCLEP